MLQAVGGLTKVAIQREVGAGRNMTCTEEMLSLLKTKFSEKSRAIQGHIIRRLRRKEN